MVHGFGFMTLLAKRQTYNELWSINYERYLCAESEKPRPQRRDAKL